MKMRTADIRTLVLLSGALAVAAMTAPFAQAQEVTGTRGSFFHPSNFHF
jgi:hypothetical protein